MNQYWNLHIWTRSALISYLLLNPFKSFSKLFCWTWCSMIFFYYHKQKHIRGLSDSSLRLYWDTKGLKRPEKLNKAGGFNGFKSAEAPRRPRDFRYGTTTSGGGPEWSRGMAAPCSGSERCIKIKIIWHSSQAWRTEQLIQHSLYQ